MTVPLALLGLLEAEPAHGYTLKRAYDEHFGRARPLRFGQVYATLARLERDGWARLVGVEAGVGPDRKTYAITAEGVTALEEWIRMPDPTNGFTPSALFVKVVLALKSGRSPHDVLVVQQRAHLARMREITAGRHDGDEVDRLAGDFEIAHLEADLRWIETAGRRLGRLTPEGGAAAEGTASSVDPTADPTASPTVDPTTGSSAGPTAGPSADDVPHAVQR